MTVMLLYTAGGSVVLGAVAVAAVVVFAGFVFFLVQPQATDVKTITAIRSIHKTRMDFFMKSSSEKQILFAPFLLYRFYKSTAHRDVQEKP